MSAFEKKWVKWIKENKTSYEVYASNPIIQKYLDKLQTFGKTFIDYGFGSGYLAIALANRDKSVTGIEINEELYKIASEQKDLSFLSDKGKLNFIMDKKDLPVNVDCVYSDGLLEHFDDEKIIEILKEQMKYSDTIVFNVPTKYYPWTTFGDERLLKLEDWENILKPLNKYLTELYYYADKFFLIGVLKGWKTKSQKQNLKQ